MEYRFPRSIVLSSIPCEFVVTIDKNSVYWFRLVFSSHYSFNNFFFTIDAERRLSAFTTISATKTENGVDIRIEDIGSPYDTGMDIVKFYGITDNDDAVLIGTIIVKKEKSLLLELENVEITDSQ